MRGGVSFRGIGVKTATFKLKSTITAADEGKAVAMTAAQEVGLGADGDILVGKLAKVEGDGYGTVEFAGCLYLPYDADAAPTVGKQVVVDGAGNVKNAPETAVNEGGAANLTIVEKGRGVIIDLDTTNHIAVVLV